MSAEVDLEGMPPGTRFVAYVNQYGTQMLMRTTSSETVVSVNGMRFRLEAVVASTVRNITLPNG